MRALTTGEESGVKTLVAHSIAGAVVHAKVIAIALGRGSRGQTSRKGDSVEVHGCFVRMLGYLDIGYRS